MIAIAGGKGGCGKTTIALGVARVLARDAPVTVVDADLDMPDLHVRTETPTSPGMDALASGTPLERCRQRAIGLPGVSIVPAGEGCRSIEQALDRLRDVQGYVIVDTPAGASLDVTRPLRAATDALLVSTPTRESLVDTAKTAALARSVGTSVLGLVLNKSDGGLDPTELLDCNTIAHIPAVGTDRPHLTNTSVFSTIATSLDKRNA